MTEALHEFIDSHRSEIVGLCTERMKEYAPDRSDEELNADLPLVLDEIVGALQKELGLPAQSPLPETSPTATRHGGQRQEKGYAIELIARDFGSISDVVGELAAKEALRFSAKEYRAFNLCIDTSVAAAIEQFSKQAQHQHETETAHRVGFLAHELRNALSSARISFTVLKHGQVGIHSRTGDVLDRALKRLERLIGDMLVSVQLHSGPKPALMRLRLKDLLTGVAHSAVSERDIVLTLDIDENIEVDVDERLMVSAISNLVQNAFKFTKRGGHITLRAHMDAPGSVLIEVEDECGGLPPGSQERIFQPFVQHGHNRSGLGLGLAITREAVEAHGGELSVRNLPERGCVFSVRLRQPIS